MLSYNHSPMDMDTNINEPDEGDSSIVEISGAEFDRRRLPRRAPLFAPPTQRQPLNSVDDLTDSYLANIIMIVTDVQPVFIANLIRRQLSLEDPGDVLNIVINHLIDRPDYPKVEVHTEKRKHAADAPAAGPSEKGKQKDEEPKRPRIDWESLDRVSPSEDYQRLAKNQLELDFKYVSRPYIRDAFTTQNNLYFPTYFYIKGQKDQPNFQASKKVPTSPSKGKGKRVSCAIFDAERKAVTDALEMGRTRGASSAIVSDELILGVAKCHCCFEEFAPADMVKCPGSHMFCKNCVRITAEEAIVEKKSVPKCMHQSGCGLEFEEKVLQSLLCNKTLEILDNIRTERAVLDAGVIGLRACPFCDFKGIIENDQEGLFHCLCKIISCLQCRKEDHRPKTCEEAKQDRSLGGRHAVEESMTEALTRQCPGCATAFIKSDGCNKMTCPVAHCKTLSCYICRKAVKSGYEHFGASVGKCPMYDDLDKRHHDEVTAAARTATATQKERNPDIDVASFEVDLPVVQPREHRARPAFPRDAPDIPERVLRMGPQEQERWAHEELRNMLDGLAQQRQDWGQQLAQEQRQRQLKRRR